MREGRSGSDHRNVLIQPTQHPSPHRLLHCGEILWPQRGRQTRNTVSLLEVGLVPNVLRSSLECGLEHRIGPLTRIFHQTRNYGGGLGETDWARPPQPIDHSIGKTGMPDMAGQNPPESA